MVGLVNIGQQTFRGLGGGTVFTVVEIGLLLDSLAKGGSPTSTHSNVKLAGGGNER